MPLNQFLDGIDAMIDDLQQAPRIDDTLPVVYPGMREHDTAVQRMIGGIPLADTELAELHALATRFGMKPLEGT